MAKKGNYEKHADIIDDCKQLNAQFVAYETVYVHRAHAELYKLLADIMCYVVSITELPDADEIILAVRKYLKDMCNIKTTTKTGAIGVLLRLIMIGAHRKTLFTYKRVIQQAIAAGVSADELAEYIERNEGINNLSKSTEAKALAEKKRMQEDLEGFRTAYYLNACAEKRVLAEFVVDSKFENCVADEAGVGDFYYAICTRRMGGFSLLGFAHMDNELEAKIQRSFYKRHLKLYKSNMDNRKNEADLLRRANELYAEHMKYLHGDTLEVIEVTD